MQRHINPSPATNNEDDFISKLPDSLLIEILSLLPESDANRTRILSKRWTNLYAFLPNLHFVSPTEQVSRFYNFIDQTFAIRDNVPIQSFFLDSSNFCKFKHLNRCLSAVCRLKVQHLYLRLPYYIYWELFKTCNTLVELTLTGGFRLVQQARILFPSLKKLCLINVAYSSKVFTNLISGCPVLEELVVERDFCGKYDRSGTYMVCSQTLKRLTICLSSNLKYKVVIDALKLEYLYISDDTVSSYVLTETLSLVEAHISYGSRYVGHLLTRLSSVQILTLTNTTIKTLSYIYDEYVNPPMFPNLVKLVIGIDCGWDRDLLMKLLNKMPNLEHITFSDGISGNSLLWPWNPSFDPPDCLCFKMKEIVIHSGEAVRQEEFLISYFLKHSYMLEKLKIIAHNIDPEKQKQLLNFSRGPMCQIELVQR